MLDLDEAFERFHRTEPEYGEGFPNLGPMAVEALFTLGHPALSQGLVDLYVPRLRPLEPGHPIPEPHQATALGRPERFPDWVATLERELAPELPQRVVQRRTRQWIEGAFGSAMLAVVRTAHAMRALQGGDTSARRKELAHALAGWAAFHQRPPQSPMPTGAPKCSPADVLRAVPAVPAGLRKPGPLSPRLLELAKSEAFGAALEGLDPTLDLESSLRDVCVVLADSFLEDPLERAAHTYAFICASSMRSLAPLLSAESRGDALRSVSIAIAAFHALSREPQAPRADTDPEAVRSLAESAAELRYRAACSLDEHRILYVEACLREDAREPDIRLRRAAAFMALQD